MCSQYLDFKKLAESVNLFMKQVIKISGSNSLEELCSSVNRHLRDVLEFDEVKLWIVNEMTGILFTFNENGEKTSIMSNKGLLGESLKLSEAAFKKKEKDKYLYRILSTGQKVTTDNTLLNPIKISGSRPSAVLEVKIAFLFSLISGQLQQRNHLQRR